MKSERVVSFISNLVPSYQSRLINEVACAESLDDGTLIIPIIDEQADAVGDAWVSIRWQGDPARQAEVQADSVATIAVVRHMRLHYAGQPLERMAREMEALAQHYEFKTGGSLYLPYERAPAGVLPVVRTAVARLGESAVIEVLKKAAGI